MIKNTSIASLVSVSLFMLLTFNSSKFQSGYEDGAVFGWPFIFFSAGPEKEILAVKSFSLLNLTLDMFICISFGFILVRVLAMFKVERKSRRLA